MPRIDDGDVVENNVKLKTETSLDSSNDNKNKTSSIETTTISTEKSKKIDMKQEEPEIKVKKVVTPPPKKPLDIKRETLKDGTTIETWPNGRITRRCLGGDTHTKFPDGTEKISNSQGASRTTRPDGSWTQIDTDGTEVTQLADGTKTFKLPSGQTLVNYPDGRRVQRNPDGTIRFLSKMSVVSITHSCILNNSHFETLHSNTDCDRN